MQPVSAQQNQTRSVSGSPEHPRLQPNTIPTATAVLAPMQLAGLTMHPHTPCSQCLATGEDLSPFRAC